ncbi:MAG: hypothetical protein A3E38_03125 [Candidatus Moranbacteria bacterium RIFCSPHIGHO2_12_FULL_54_9]|nr:MAG: hypothetical protein A2878_00290 [Candidatus Moranbacteria bacterium RIFCSPHIGHO2_01_FULL_54_31]OGI25730.1 MAG: hypothetical protein A3E38_03125 [Candidatus Moranbacteria bacterium RIFCSPHIGHO2_12_FULL_54_9]
MPLSHKTLHIKGSTLVFSLIVLSFLLVSALSVATVVMTEKKAALSTDKSNRAFQVADSGVESMLQKIYKNDFATLNELAASLGTTCNGSTGEISVPLSSGTYTISFYDNENIKFDGGDCSDDEWRDRVVKIKSEGVSNNTTRAIEVSVLAREAACNGPQTYGGGYVTEFTNAYLTDNSGANGASTASLACGESGPSSPAPGQLNIRFYMHSTSGCLVGFRAPIPIAVPFSGNSNVWTCGGMTTYLESVTCTTADCKITSTVRITGQPGVYQQYESTVPRPKNL